MNSEGPGILLIHGGAGLDEHARDQARRYAELGYTVLACDMFGDGVAGDPERVMACLTALRNDPAFLVRRGPSLPSASVSAAWLPSRWPGRARTSPAS